jgi:outer membrane receptor protein involved in Fe transport
VRTDGYFLADLSASWTFASRWSVDAELQNLFNAKYPEVRASGFLNPGAPRVLRVELRLH